ncbi:abhd17c, partial [Symbiodinium microadriaticum]
MGTLELAIQDVDDSGQIAKQICEELGVPCPSYLEGTARDWVLGARAGARLQQRVSGATASQLTWERLSPPVQEKKLTPVEQPEWKPPPGERNRKLLDEGCISLAREERLQELWVTRLKLERKDIGAPVLAKLQGSLDPDRAANLLVGRTRSSTLKRYLTYYKQWRLWLGEAKLRLPPGRPADLVDFLLSRRDEPCGRTVPEATLKAIAWVEQVAEFPLEQRASHGRLAWAAKDRIVEELSTGAKLTKRAPRYPVYMVAQLERVVMDMGQAVGLRIWAWGKLLKVWGTLRWSDLQAIIPGELSLVEGRLVTTLRRTKTSGASRRVKELPVCISERGYLARSGWLATGFNLLKDHAGYKRDYLLPRLGSDGGLERKMASYADAMVATAALLTAMGLPGVVQGFWTEHSERAILPTALSLQDVAPQDKDLLGRWKPEGSDTYARAFGGRVARLQAQFARAARRPDRYEVLDERDIAATLEHWLEQRGVLNDSQIAELVEPLRETWRTAKLDDPDGEVGVPPFVVPEDLSRDSSASESSEQSSPSKQLGKRTKVQEREACYVIVELPGGVARLHKAGRQGCWMGRKRAFRSSREYLEAPARHAYTHVCKLCWPKGGLDSGSEATEGSEAATNDAVDEPEVSSGAQGPEAGPLDAAALAQQAYALWQDQLEEGLVDLGQQLLGRLVARARAARLRALETEPVPVKAPPAIAKKAAAPKAPPPLLLQNTAARSPSPGARVWYGGSANKLAPNAMQQAARAALDRKVRYAVAWTDFTPDEEELLTRDQLRYLMNRFQAAALGAIPDATAREEAEEVESRAMEARAEAEEERAMQEAALLVASREAQRREEEELRAALEASRRAAMDDGPVVEGANSGDAPALQPQRPLLWNMAYGEALKLQETAKAKGNSALKGKGVPMDLLQPPPARTLATGMPRGSDGHLLELSWRSINPKYGRPLGSYPPGHEPKGKGLGKLKGGQIDYASLIDYEDLPLTQDSDLDLVCQLPGPTTPHAKALASMVPVGRYVHAGERRAVLGYGRSSLLEFLEKIFATWTFAMVEASLAKGSSDLRFLLTHHKVTADVQAKLYDNSIDTVAKFAAFVSDAADLREVLKSDLGIDPASSLSLRAQAASLMVAWETAKARVKTQAEAEATNEVREWAKPIPQTDYIAMRQAFATQFGDLEDKHIPAKEYIEKKLHELETGEFRAEPLTEVISRDEVDPDVLLPRWNASGTLSIAKGGSRTTAPSGPEQLRLRLTVLQNALIMIKLKRPGRAELADVTFAVFERYKDYLLGDYCYGLRSSEESGSVIPPWPLILSYEHAIRKHAYKLMATDGRPFGDALAKAYKEATVKERHFTTPLALHAKRLPPKTLDLVLKELGATDVKEKFDEDVEETIPGDPDSQLVYVNLVGTFGLSCASYWWTRIAACGVRLVYHLLGPRFPLDLLLYADDLESLGRTPAGRQGIPLSYLFLATLGYPFKWPKTRGGFRVEWLGMETDYPGHQLGLSKKRADWLVEWLRDKATRGRVSAKEFSQGLGRLGFAAMALDWERPFLGPLHAWSSAVQTKVGTLTVPTMLRVLCLWLAERLEAGGRLQRPAPLVEEGTPLSFFTDAKAEAGKAWIGGFLELVPGQGPWFSLEVQQSWAPWAFAKGDPNKVIAALELLATLVAVKLWVPEGPAKKTTRVAIRGYTDNKSNEALLKKAMTTKFPSTLVLMETAEELSAKNCEL